jgi:hypothetical protein
MAFQLILLFVSVDFPVCTFESSQYASHITYAHDCFYVTYVDDRHYYPYQSLYGCRVTNQGAVLDPDGKLFYRGEVGSVGNIVSDGMGFLVVFRDSC